LRVVVAVAVVTLRAASTHACWKPEGRPLVSVVGSGGPKLILLDDATKDQRELPQEEQTL